MQYSSVVLHEVFRRLIHFSVLQLNYVAVSTRRNTRLKDEDALEVKKI